MIAPALIPMCECQDGGPEVRTGLDQEQEMDSNPCLGDGSESNLFLTPKKMADKINNDLGCEQKMLVVSWASYITSQRIHRGRTLETYFRVFMSEI